MLPTAVLAFLNTPPGTPTNIVADRWHNATAELANIQPSLIRSNFYFWAYNNIKVKHRGDLYQLCPNGFTGLLHFAPIGYEIKQQMWRSAELTDAIVIIPNPNAIIHKLESYLPQPLLV